MRKNISPSFLCLNSPELSLWAQDVVDAQMGMTPFIDESVALAGFLSGLAKGPQPSDPVAKIGWLVARDEQNPLRKSGLGLVKSATENIQEQLKSPRRAMALA